MSTPIPACAHGPRPAQYNARLYPLTLARLVEYVSRYGADPDTVTLHTDAGPVMDCDDDFDIARDNGALTITFLGVDGEW